MGGSNSKQDTEAIWNNIKTENMSATMPNVKGLSKDAKKLISSLNLPPLSETQSEMNIDNILESINSKLSKEDQIKFNNIIESISPGISEVLSDTSPFMSMEMYNNMVNTKTSEEPVNMVGGGYHSRSIKKDDTEANTLTHKYGGKKDSSSTSSITSTSSLEDLDSSDSDSDLTESLPKHKNKPSHAKAARASHKKSKGKKSKSHRAIEISEASVLSGGDDLSYVSSSAHTDGDFSDSESVVEEQSHHSVSNENSMVTTSVSVNTEDINYVDSD
jgi:hypothetical protein